MDSIYSLWNKLGSHGVMVLAACAENSVTSRAISVVVIDGKLYCQTDERYLKCQQIKANPNISLCVNNFSLEGNCRIIGKPYDNEFFITAMKRYFPDAVLRWSKLPMNVCLKLHRGL
ncbi:pyridoxamine 5'-phosphate oxidase family protein [Hominimerdicola sp. 21CYCFAH17_S]